MSAAWTVALMALWASAATQWALNLAKADRQRSAGYQLLSVAMLAVSVAMFCYHWSQL